MEKVIFRQEYDKYTKEWGYLAIFPDDPALPGRVAAVPFKKISSDYWVFEGYGEIDYFYMLNQKIIHKNDEVIPELVEALKSMYGGEYKVCEKIMR